MIGLSRMTNAEDVLAATPNSVMTAVLKIMVEQQVRFVTPVLSNRRVFMPMAIFCTLLGVGDHAQAGARSSEISCTHVNCADLLTKDRKKVSR